MLQRVFWKLIPREQRSFLLSRLSAVDRQVVPVREFCSTRTRRLVRRVYERDYEWLGYE